MKQCTGIEVLCIFTHVKREYVGTHEWTNYTCKKSDVSRQLYNGTATTICLVALVASRAPAPAKSECSIPISVPCIVLGTMREVSAVMLVASEN